MQISGWLLSDGQNIAMQLVYVHEIYLKELGLSVCSSLFLAVISGSFTNDNWTEHDNNSCFEPPLSGQSKSQNNCKRGF